MFEALLGSLPGRAQVTVFILIAPAAAWASGRSTGSPAGARSGAPARTSVPPGQRPGAGHPGAHGPQKGRDARSA
jgi:hypothetical protein